MVWMMKHVEGKYFPGCRKIDDETAGKVGAIIIGARAG